MVEGKHELVGVDLATTNVANRDTGGVVYHSYSGKFKNFMAYGFGRVTLTNSSVFDVQVETNGFKDLAEQRMWIEDRIRHALNKRCQTPSQTVNDDQTPTQFVNDD